MPSYRRCVTGMLALFLLGCASQPLRETPTRRILPTPKDRTAAGIANRSLFGSQTDQRSPGAVEQGTTLTLAPAEDGFEWAIYRFEMVDGEPHSITADLALQETSGAWLAVFDFTAQRWQMHGPYSGPVSQPLANALHISPAGNVYVAVLASAESQALIAGLQLTSLVNEPPIAAIVAMPEAGDPGALAALDASGSYDPDGVLASYEWDLDGNGFVPGAAQTSVMLPDPIESLVIKLRVTDEDGTATTTEKIISSRTPGWKSTRIDSISSYITGLATGYGTTLHIVGGYPVVAYAAKQQLGEELRVAAATTLDGSLWNKPEEAFNAVSSRATLLTLNEGRPLLAYVDTGGTLRSLVYNWNYLTGLETVDGDPGTAGPPSGINLNGHAALAYVQSPSDWGRSGKLMFARCKSVFSGPWLQPEVVVDSNSEYVDFENPTLLNINGYPAICYKGEEGFSDRLYFVRALDTSGQQWGTPVVASQDAPLASTAAIVNGHPAACYYVSDSTKRIRYVRASDALGDTWNAPITIEELQTPLGLDGLGTSLAEIGGHPAVAYGARGNTTGSYDLRYARALDPDGAAWGDPEIPESAGFTGGHPSLAELNGQPAISYFNLSLKEVRFATFVP